MRARATLGIPGNLFPRNGGNGVRARRACQHAGAPECPIHVVLSENNRQPKPFVWKASVEKILAKVERCKAILASLH